MTLTEWRKNKNLEAEDLSEMTGLSINYIKNFGYKDIKDFSNQTQKFLKLLEELEKIKEENKILRKLIN